MSSPNKSKSPTFASNVLTLVTGTTIAQIITILASPIITRLYGPEAFGLVAIFISITSIIGVISCLRYELAIMLPESNEEAANVFGLCIILVVFITLLSTLFLIILQQPLFLAIKAPQLASFLWLIPIAIFFSGIFLSLNYWNTRTKHFHRLSIARVVGTCSITGTQLGFGCAGLTSGGILIGANVLGSISSTSILGLQIMRDDLSLFRRTITPKRMTESLKRYRNFIKYDIWSALLNSLSWQVPILLLAYFFSASVVGYYSLGMMVIQLPMSLIGSAIGQVFYQRAAVAKSEGTLNPLVENVFKILVKIVLFPMILLLFIGKDIFIVIFGAQWAEAGIFIQILSMWAIVWFISSPMSMLVPIFEKQRWSLVYNFSNFLTRIISIIIGGLFGIVLVALTLFSISGIIVYGYLCLKMFEFSNVSKRLIIDTFTPDLIWIIPVCIFLLIIELLKVNSIFIVYVSFLIGIIYYFYLYKTDSIIHTIINQYLSLITRANR